MIVADPDALLRRAAQLACDEPSQAGPSLLEIMLWRLIGDCSRFITRATGTAVFCPVIDPWRISSSGFIRRSGSHLRYLALQVREELSAVLLGGQMVHSWISRAFWASATFRDNTTWGRDRAEVSTPWLRRRKSRNASSLHFRICCSVFDECLLLRPLNKTVRRGLPIQSKESFFRVLSSMRCFSGC